MADSRRGGICTARNSRSNSLSYSAPVTSMRMSAMELPSVVGTPTDDTTEQCATSTLNEGDLDGLVSWPVSNAIVWRCILYNLNISFSVGGEPIPVCWIVSTGFRLKDDFR